MKLELCVAYALLLNAECAKILGVFPAPGYSQFILGEVLMTELAHRGHEITVISPYKPEKEPSNYRTILTQEMIQAAKTSNTNYWDRDSRTIFQNIMSIHKFGSAITEYTLKNTQVQELLHSDEHFDLVIVEHFFTDALTGFASHFKAPLALFSSMGLTEWNKESMGIPMLPVINAMSLLGYTNKMNVFQRLKNVVAICFNYLYHHYVVQPMHRKYMEKYFSTYMDFDKVVNNASLMFLNSHVTTSENVLLPYNVIEIGGFHIVNKSLDKETKEYLDGATDGAVLFSLGTNLRSSDLTQQRQKLFLDVFRQLKQKVLWKFETDLPDKPTNVLISKWLKQREILAHPNVKLFITHGGLLSTTESIVNGVPMVGIPVFADQKMNMVRAKTNGVANVVLPSELSEETLFAAVNETINNPLYKDNARRMSAMIRDRVVKPLDLAIYWIEHTIRYKGMRFEAANSCLYWYEMYMVDVLCFILFTFVFCFYLTKCMLNNVTIWLKSGRKNKNKQL